MHAPEGYGNHLVCVCVCVCVLCLLLYFQRYSIILFIFMLQKTIVIGFLLYFLDIYKHDFFVQKFRSKVMASVTYCDIRRCCCSEILLDSQMTQPFALLKKGNDR